MCEACDVHLCLSGSGILVILASSSIRAGACRMGRFSKDLRLSLMRTLTVNCYTADSLGLKMFEDFMWHRLQVPTFQVIV